MRDDFAVMICSHGRAETMTTYDILRKQGYTGKIIVVIDDEDDQRELYESRYECVEVFSKDEYADAIDEVVTNNRGSVVYARNACYDIAAKYGLEYFVEVDDDLLSLKHRYIEDGKARGSDVNDLDTVFSFVLPIFENENIFCISFVKNSDFMGGVNSKGFKKGFEYTAHSIFCLKTDRRVKFASTIFEDLNTSLTYNRAGKIFISLAVLQFYTKEVGTGNGGSSALYDKFSPFARAFSVLMARPDSMKIMTDKKEGHKIHMNWSTVAPMIIPERWKK